MSEKELQPTGEGSQQANRTPSEQFSKGHRTRLPGAARADRSHRGRSKPHSWREEKAVLTGLGMGLPSRSWELEKELQQGPHQGPPKVDREKPGRHLTAERRE